MNWSLVSVIAPNIKNTNLGFTSDTNPPIMKDLHERGTAPHTNFLSFFSMHFESNDLSRVFRMPYTKENHEFVNEMTEKIMKGDAVGVKFKDNDQKRNLDLREGEKDFRVEYDQKIITK